MGPPAGFAAGLAVPPADFPAPPALRAAGRLRVGASARFASFFALPVAGSSSATGPMRGAPAFFAALGPAVRPRDPDR